MRAIIRLITVSLLVLSQLQLHGEPRLPKETMESAPLKTDPGKLLTSDRADKRFDEMLSKMRDAVQGIAESYGNPIFIQVFTNDREKALLLKQRLQSSKRGEQIRVELSNLEKKRDDLISDIALKTQEASKLSDRLARQRSALDALASVVERADNAVEDTSR
jgi:hypothetical protein